MHIKKHRNQFLRNHFVIGFDCSCPWLQKVDGFFAKASNEGAVVLISLAGSDPPLRVMAFVINPTPSNAYKSHIKSQSFFYEERNEFLPLKDRYVTVTLHPLEKVTR